MCFEINGDLYVTFARCTRLLHIGNNRLTTLLCTTEITSYWINGTGARYLCLSEIQTALAAQDAARAPESVAIDGELYYPVRHIARRVHLVTKSIDYLIKTNKVRHTKVNNRAYVCLSDVQRWADRRSNLQRIGEWWALHQAEHAQVGDSYDLQRRLRRDGIKVSSALVRTWRAKALGYVHELTDDVLAWLEADPQRCQLRQSEILRLLPQENPPIRVSRQTVKRALKRYERKHGITLPQHPKLPPPRGLPAGYVEYRKLAEERGVAPSALRVWFRTGQVRGKVHKDTLYLDRAGVEALWRGVIPEELKGEEVA